MPKLFIPQDTAVAVGAEQVAVAFQSAIDTTDSSYSSFAMDHARFG